MRSTEVFLINRTTLKLNLMNKMEGRGIASSGPVFLVEVTGFL
jgi:hypothetical protein